MRTFSLLGMYRDPTVRGVVVQFDQPSWRPLEVALGKDMAGWFMWLHEVRLEDGTRVDAYKHKTTRRCLHLAADGQALAYGADDTYRAVGLAPAIVRAFDGWERSSPPARHLRALKRAVAAARGVKADALSAGRGN